MQDPRLFSLLLGAESHRLSLFYRDHDNPHGYLGPHAVRVGDERGVIVRAKQPRASAASLVTSDGRDIEMTSLGHDHFAVYLPGADPEMSYRLRFSFGEQQDNEWLREDPYRFPSLLDEQELYYLSEGTHHRLWQTLGCREAEHGGVKGLRFAVWAPNARSVALAGDWNGWDPGVHPMRRLGSSGVWELFVPDLASGHLYKFDIKGPGGQSFPKADPLASWAEVPPGTAARTWTSSYEWGDSDWMDRVPERNVRREPMAIYEVHLGSWAAGGGKNANYRELAPQLVEHVKALGFNYLELMPVAEHPYDGSWGYQVTGYFAPTSRFGTPDDFRYFVDYCHQHGVGVILDWVPAHFVKDAHGLGRFDGTALYEHQDPRRGEHPDWGTYIFNYGRFEVKNFLVANALYWLDTFHIDGLRVDAVASMLYLDYSREEGQWLPNEQGGHENYDAIALLREVNRLVRELYPGRFVIAEESTAWPGITERPGQGGLGFTLKWNMGWMHDTLDYFSMDAWFRQFHQNNLTFSMWYHHSENYMLALSHDEVVHGKSNIIGKVPGDEWQKMANIRALFGYMFTHPGKKTMFMSMEFGQWNEWNVWTDLDWDLLQYDPHQQLKQFFGDLNRLYKAQPALYDRDFEEPGFDWIDCSDNNHSVISFLRRGKNPNEFLVIVCNFTPQPHSHYRIGVPEEGFYKELFNSDASKYGGSNMGNMGGKWTDEWSFHNLPYSLDLCLPPLAVMVFKLDRTKTAEAFSAS